MSAQEELQEDTSQTNKTSMEEETIDNFSDRGASYRSTVARKCREFYLRRLERTETLQRRWSVTATTTLLSEMKVEKVDTSRSPEVEDSSGVESEGSTCSGDGQSLQSRRRSEPVKRVVTTDLSANIKENNNNINNVNDEDGDRAKSDCQSNHRGQDDDKSAGEINQTGSDLPPLRKWNSTLDLAMHNLRQEITSLIAQDNDLFRQLLSLNDSIVELREQQKRNLELSQLEDDEDDEDNDEFDGGSRSPSLESLSDPDTSATTPSPASTLSSSCSSHYSRNKNVKNNGHHHANGSSRRPALPSSMRNGNPGGSCHQYHRHHGSHDGGRPRSSGSNLCLRCHSSSSGKMAAMPLLRRRAHSQATLHWKRDDFDSYDSGIHLQGSHSDSDHEIFV